MGFIYKITNIITGKCYIGETVQIDPYKRWKKHLNCINYKDEGCPALKEAMKKYGINKFKFEVLIICFDEDRYKYEKEYIKKYNSQVPNGYNILPGGEKGKSRLGIKHSNETKVKLSKSCKKFHLENPNHYETFKEVHQKAMEKVNLSFEVKNSETYKLAVSEGRVGGKAHKDGKVSEETKIKIKKSLLNYYEINIQNIEVHRQAMTKAVGRKVAQYTADEKLIKEYNSIASAGRESGVKKSNIQHVLSGKTCLAGGYIWKYVDEKNLKN